MIITLTTDFGLRDPFVGIMKGVILGIASDARLVDITHEIASHDIFEAALALSTAYKFFPPETIHVAVVDPGVGSARRPIAARVRNHRFVAPDNGLLSLVFDSVDNPLDSEVEVFQLTETQYFREPVSNTFQGRD